MLQEPAAEPLLMLRPKPDGQPVVGTQSGQGAEGDAAPQEPAERQRQQRPSPFELPATGDQVAAALDAAGGHSKVLMLEQQEGDSLAAEEQGQGQWQPVRTSRASPAHPRQQRGRAAEYQLAPADAGRPGGLQHAAPSSTRGKLAGVAAASEHDRAVPGGHQAGIEAAAAGQWSHAPVPEQQPDTERQAAPADGQPTPPATPADQQADAVQQLAAQRAEGQLLRQQLAAAEAALRREVATATELRGALQVGRLTAATSVSCWQAHCLAKDMSGQSGSEAIPAAVVCVHAVMKALSECLC